MELVSLFIFVSLMLSSTTLTQQHNLESWTPQSRLNGSGDEGWQWLPEVVDATPVYQTAGLDTTEVTRAVIVLQGKQRNCWSSWNVANNAFYNATYNDATIQRSQISITGPCFLSEADLNAGAAQEGAALMGKHDMDQWTPKLAHYMERSVYPNLKVLVVGGHSAGSQMAQRYAALLHFWVANPASLCWLTSERPIPNDACEGYDKFKYGLQSNFPAYATENARTLGRDGIIKRYYNRTLNYAWGLTQGHTRLERGQNFVAKLEDMDGIPNLTTFDWVPGVGHSAQNMTTSDAGIDKLFRYMGNIDSA
ncbi:uncharacterized protein EV420DRAFT_1766246 [Desarmillaria tabescens]|uniref:Fungal lipase-like domain-containing protein n=1 Tax=Armillaria tabescens TaxID=1929756 RepID=A0AA39K0K5_ARMTA|nr:uncharacterized protein EV420DRAFT_1766246 [Desarmillaria tabescens]KAK0452168.1 hypothetical protein EV420DRAFT_1766246 [Desarmillaria tabescens]